MHTEVWKGTLQDGLDKWEADKLVQEVQAGYTKAFKRKPSRGERASWSNSIPQFLQALDGGLSDELGLTENRR